MPPERTAEDHARRRQCGSHKILKFPAADPVNFTIGMPLAEQIFEPLIAARNDFPCTLGQIKIARLAIKHRQEHPERLATFALLATSAHHFNVQRLKSLHE